MDIKKTVIDLSSQDKMMEGILIKKKDLTDTTPMLYLENLCKNAKSGHFNETRNKKIIAQRILALEDAGIVYIENDEDVLFEQTIEELEILKDLI